MGIHRGPKIVTNGLVFGYDANDRSPRFYPGEPTVNEATSSYGTGMIFWINSGGADATNDDITISKPTVSINNPNITIHSAVVTSTGNIQVGSPLISVTPGASYSVSIYAYFATSTMQTNPYVRTYTTNVGIVNFAYNGSTTFSDWPKNQWIRLTAHVTIPAEDNMIYLSSYIGDAVGDKVYYSTYQVEQKSHVTPFVYGTRSITQSVIELASTKSPNIVYVNGHDYPIEEDSNGKWVKIFHHYNAGGTILFGSSTEAALTNEGNQSANKFSIFSRLEKFRRSDGKFKFKINYPEISNGWNTWYQTSNPNTDSIAGYEAGIINQPNYNFGGIAQSTGPTWLDCSPASGNWYFAVGCYSEWNGAIPGPISAINYVDVYVSMENTNLSNNPIDASNVSFDNTGHPVFDGTNDYIDCGAYLSNLDTSILTLDIWFKSEDTSDSFKPLLSWNAGDYESYVCLGDFTGAWPNESLSVYLRPTGVDYLSFAYTNGHSFLKDNKFHNAVIILQTNGYKMYIDGTEAAINPNFRNGSQSTTMPSNLFNFFENSTFFIGKTYSVSMLGKIPQFRIYNKALSSIEVQQNYNAHKNQYNI